MEHLTRELLKALDEAVAEQVASFMARGMSEADARARSLAALSAAAERHRAHDAFLAELAAS